MTYTTYTYKNNSSTKTKPRNKDIALSVKIWDVLIADLQNPDQKHYAQSVLKRAMEAKDD